MTTKELKEAIIKSYEKDEGKAFDLIIDFERKIRIDKIKTWIEKMNNDDDAGIGFLLLYLLFAFIIIFFWR